MNMRDHVFAGCSARNMEPNTHRIMTAANIIASSAHWPLNAVTGGQQPEEAHEELEARSRPRERVCDVSLFREQRSGPGKGRVDERARRGPAAVGLPGMLNVSSRIMAGATVALFAFRNTNLPDRRFRARSGFL